jgi:hypothetical protein
LPFDFKRRQERPGEGLNLNLAALRNLVDRELPAPIMITAIIHKKTLRKGEAANAIEWTATVLISKTREFHGSRT